MGVIVTVTLAVTGTSLGMGMSMGRGRRGILLPSNDHHQAAREVHGLEIGLLLFMVCAVICRFPPERRKANQVQKIKRDMARLIIR